ncbi:hypothetical protein KDA_28350 [Dictyobacter alpinus]|uniref:Uncharacterized protein n=1 Tax=Dictyobacter alpinus TaxID=2014873 RepID=A0A402B7L4_9CHLR|nr:hypothetical protein KDA_28350 [Dictyobacter alpinus]
MKSMPPGKCNVAATLSGRLPPAAAWWLAILLVRLPHLYHLRQREFPRDTTG